MKSLPRLPLALTGWALVSLLAACGGGGSDSVSDKGTAASAGGLATILKGGSPAPAPAPAPDPAVASPLPTTAPAPDILVRESFGLGPDLVRPAGGKGTLKDSRVHVGIGGFWVEWPGAKGSAWIAPDAGQTWRFCGTAPSPYELPSPLQDITLGTAGCAVSDWSIDSPNDVHPAALLPFTAPATAWQLSMEGYPSVVAGAYVAIGLTNSAALTSNLETVGQVWLSLHKQEPMVNGPLVYELRLNGRSGPVLATGVTDDLSWNRMVIGYDPVAQVMTASVNGIDLGRFPMKLSAKYAGFEGIGILDNFVIRQVNTAVQ
ncbi:hypothetical protein [Aquabacterium sp.]|uniref:hypothetical protein n=1 Tax=Aquabacterium sp. TaxID=1872578 RepID=UPI00378367C6